MANVEKVSVALTPEMLAVVHEAIESGEYASTSEVMREALRDWKTRRALKQTEVDALRNLWREGLASGPGRLGDLAAIKAEARRLIEAQECQEPGT